MRTCRHVLLATSRPDGIVDKQYASARFRRLKLLPLSAPQQQAALEQRLGAERAQALLPYLERMPPDESGVRITANPRELLCALNRTWPCLRRLAPLVVRVWQ